MSVLQLKKPIAADDVTAGLRGLADRIEAGEIEFPVSTCLVILGHTKEGWEGDNVIHSSDHELFGYGPRCDTFTVRGLLTTAVLNH